MQQSELKDAELPDGWEYVGYEPYGQRVDVLRAHARGGNPHSKITYFAGFKPDPSDFQSRRIEAYQRAGYEIDFVLMPEVGNRTDYFDEYAWHLSGILLDSPPSGHFVDDTHHFVYANSISGRSLVRSFFDDRFARDIGKDYTGAVTSAAHFRCPFEEKTGLNLAYKIYAYLNWNKRNGEGALDWALPLTHQLKSVIKGGTGKNADYVSSFSVEQSPTHGQVLSSVWSGKDLYDELEQLDVPQATLDFPIVMLAGTDDFVTACSPVKSMSEKINAHYLEVNANHNLSLQSRQAQNFVLYHMGKAAIARDREKHLSIYHGASEVVRTEPA